MYVTSNYYAILAKAEFLISRGSWTQLLEGTNG